MATCTHASMSAWRWDIKTQQWRRDCNVCSYYETYRP